MTTSAIPPPCETTGATAPNVGVLVGVCVGVGVGVGGERTVTVKMQLALLPAGSVHEHVTTVAPSGNALPEGGAQAMVTEWVQNGGR